MIFLLISTPPPKSSSLWKSSKCIAVKNNSVFIRIWITSLNLLYNLVRKSGGGKFSVSVARWRLGWEAEQLRDWVFKVRPRTFQAASLQWAGKALGCVLTLAKGSDLGFGACSQAAHCLWLRPFEPGRERERERGPGRGRCTVGSSCQQC